MKPQVEGGVRSLRYFSTFIILSIIGLIVFYFVWVYSRELIPLPIYLGVKRKTIYLLLVSCLLLFPSLVFSKFRPWLNVFLILTSFPLFCLLGILAAYNPEHILNTAEFNGYNYYLTGRGSVGDSWEIYLLYKCNSSNMDCNALFFHEAVTPIKSKLVIDEKFKEIHVILNNSGFEYFMCTDGQQPRSYVYREEFEDHIFELAMYPDFSSRGPYTYMLFKCSNTTYSCQQLPFQYNGTLGPRLIEYDKKTHKLMVWTYDRELIFTYGVLPKCHVEGCTMLEE